MPNATRLLRGPGGQLGIELVEALRRRDTPVVLKLRSIPPPGHDLPPPRQQKGRRIFLLA